MKQSELKRLIRGMVKECVNEILAEKFLEERVTRSAPSVKDIMESAAPVQRREKQQKKALDERLVRKLGLEEGNPMMSIYEDTLRNNEVLNEEVLDPVGTISEKSMKKAGLMDHDWSAHLEGII